MSSNEIVQFLFICVRGLVYDWCLKDGSFDIRIEINKLVTRLLKTM